MARAATGLCEYQTKDNKKGRPRRVCLVCVKCEDEMREQQLSLQYAKFLADLDEGSNTLVKVFTFVTR